MDSQEAAEQTENINFIPSQWLIKHDHVKCGQIGMSLVVGRRSWIELPVKQVNFYRKTGQSDENAS